MGTIVALGLVAIGLVLQLLVGPVCWQHLAWPFNLILLIVYVGALIGAYAYRRKLPAVRWSMCYKAAVPALLVASIATLLYGLTNWEGTLRCWPFVLVYLWVATIVGLVSIDRLAHFTWGRIPFLLNHLGLFIALVSATLGSADMQRLKMQAVVDVPEWRAIDDDRLVHDLPFAVKLHRFILERYPSGEPRRFASEVDVLREQKDAIHAVIDVNHPLIVDGWAIYQFSYDKSMGDEGPVSILELVRAPWLPAVYLGIAMLFAGALCMLFSTIYKRWKRRFYIADVVLIVSVCVVGWLFKHGMDAKPLVPALQSLWFAPHVTVYMFCYTALGIAMLIAIAQLVREWRGRPVSLSMIAAADQLVYVGLAFMTVGMLMGAVWAKEAWGHYWAWDPKETWAATTWLLYLTYIHLRLVSPHRVRLAMVMLIVSYMCIQMCWWGINYLPSAQGMSVHTYDLS